MSKKEDSKSESTKSSKTEAKAPAETKQKMVPAHKDRATADRQSAEAHQRLPEAERLQAESYSQNVAAGGQNPNITVVPANRGGEAKTVSSEDLRGSNQPKAPEHPVDSPKDDPIDDLDNVDPAPEGATMPVEPEEK